MRNFLISSLLALATGSSAAAKESCKCFPGDSCWPSDAEWSRLNSTVGGRLVATVPLGSPCHDPTYNAEECKNLQSEWHYSSVHTQSSSSMMAPLFANQSCDPFQPRDKPCTLGNYVRYAVNVTSAEDVTTAVKFAQKKNIRFVIRNTGHDYLGRSTGAGALSVWTHYLKGTEVIDWKDEHYKGKALKVGAGVQGFEALAAAHAKGLVVVTGECPSVGLVGGYTQGGGHSALSTNFGLAADNTLEFEVITADGKLVKANRSQNSDLYWALSGAGSGNYGVVVSATVQAHPEAKVSGASFLITAPEGHPNLIYDAIDAFHAALPKIVDSGVMIIYFFGNSFLQIPALTAYGKTEAEVKKILKPLADSLAALGLKFEPTFTNFSSYYEHYDHYWGPLPAGNIQIGTQIFGGRLLPRNKVDEFAPTARKLAGMGVTYIGVGLNVSKFGANSGNSVLPQWRDSLVMVSLTLPWDNEAPWEEMLAAQRKMTEVVQPVIEAATPGAGAYINEADFQQPDWQDTFYGANYDKLLQIKKKYDPKHLFYATVAVGSEQWDVAEDGPAPADPASLSISSSCVKDQVSLDRDNMSGAEQLFTTPSPTNDQKEIIKVGEEAYKGLQKLRTYFKELSVDKQSRKGLRGKLRVAKTGIKTLFPGKELDDLEKNFQRYQQLLQTRLIGHICNQNDAAALLAQDCFKSLDATKQSVIEGIAQGHTDLSLLIFSSEGPWSDESSSSDDDDEGISIDDDTSSSGSEGPARLHRRRRVPLEDESSFSNKSTASRRDCSGKEYSDNEETNEDSEADKDEDGSSRSDVSIGDIITSNISSWSEPTTFTSWLGSESQMFWISGKPASGKSTLMKFIATSPATKEKITVWRPNVNILPHYFWKAGSVMERSFKGFLLCLVHQVLLDRAELSHRLLQNMPDLRFKWSHDDWDIQQLETVLLWALENAAEPFFLIIDGLDESEEFEGHLSTNTQYANILDRLSKLKDVKICVSSREEYTFTTCFEGVERLQLHKLTRYDIRQFAATRLDGLTFVKPNDRDLILDLIVSRTSGVFLWVALVLDSVARAVRVNISIENFIERIDRMPRDLIDLVQGMWERSGEDGEIPSYRASASRYFNLVQGLDYDYHGLWKMSILMITITSDKRGLESMLDLIPRLSEGVDPLLQVVVSKTLKPKKTWDQFTWSNYSKEDADEVSKALLHTLLVGGPINPEMLHIEGQQREEVSRYGVEVMRYVINKFDGKPTYTMESENVQVIICGGGSAGLTAAVLLARFGISFKILEKRPGPLEIGQADGVQCRTVEIFENLGISARLLEEAYHVREVAFWSPSDTEGTLKRKDLAYDTEEGLSHQPHVILNQARINDLMLQEIIRLRGDGTSGVLYDSQVESADIVDCAGEYPVQVVASHSGETHRYRAKYAIGCDGAHSTVRKALGFKMVGDSSDSVWGVMDVYPITNFPDIRKKAMLISKNDGNLMIIPREGDELVRFYIELPGTTARDVTEQSLINKVKRIFAPYDIDVAHTAWWSAYVIGQRLADHFTKDYRVFLTGDACHTHSPKAGQGMNVSLQDGFNIGWKMAHVLTGRAPPSVLETYVLERQQTAEKLIDFDRSFSKLFSSDYRKQNGITAKDFRDKFVEAGRYTAGMATKYEPSILTCINKNDESNASGLTVGMRFPSAPVVRLSDAKPLQLNSVLAADGRWHILTFCSGDAIKALLPEVASELENLIKKFSPSTDTADKVFNNTLVIKANRKTIEIDQLPEVFFPKSGPFSLRNVHRVVVDDTSPYMLGCGEAFSKYGINPEQGAIVVVRPDLYVSRVLALTNANELSSFFKGCLNSAE
ncbi:hypothetical protein HG531_012383 [Fusarium graminearum]|nr:hypothetical protein HG531_012383 [Fusarium graminearum]